MYCEKARCSSSRSSEVCGLVLASCWRVGLAEPLRTFPDGHDFAWPPPAPTLLLRVAARFGDSLPASGYAKYPFRHTGFANSTRGASTCPRPGG